MKRPDWIGHLGREQWIAYTDQLEAELRQTQEELRRLRVFVEDENGRNMIQRYQRCAIRVWALFEGYDPLPKDSQAHGWCDRLEALVNGGQLQRRPTVVRTPGKYEHLCQKRVGNHGRCKLDPGHEGTCVVWPELPTP